MMVEVQRGSRGLCEPIKQSYVIPSERDRDRGERRPLPAAAGRTALHK